MITATRPPLHHLGPGWFSVVMGLAGLSLAWQRAQPLMGDAAGLVSWLIGMVAAAVFAALAVASAWRLHTLPGAWAEDLRHPVRHTFVATATAALILLATVWVAHGGPQPGARWLWRLGAAAHAAVTLWVLARWWRPPAAGQPAAAAWASVTPALLVPVVGNVLVPLAGVQLDQSAWAQAQFGVGLMFWLPVLALLWVRLAVQGPWPERLLPTNVILIGPPAVGGLAALQLGAPTALVWMLWGMAVFTLAWVAALLPRLARLPFGLTHWGMSFPLAALAGLTLALAQPATGSTAAGAGLGSPLAALALALLAGVTLLITGLSLATVRGLRQGSLLVPEPVATLVPAAAAPTTTATAAAGSAANGPPRQAS